MNDPEAEIWFQDEVHFNVQSTVQAIWADKGSRPTLKSNPSKDKAGYSGFVNPKTGQLIVFEVNVFNYETTLAALIRFSDKLSSGHNVYLAMDNASWHKKAKRYVRDDDGLRDIRDCINFLDVPPYSPDLMPIESVWKLTRHEVTHNRYWPNLSVLKNELDKYFGAYHNGSETLKSLCSFNFDKDKEVINSNKQKFIRKC